MFCFTTEDVHPASGYEITAVVGVVYGEYVGSDNQGFPSTYDLQTARLGAIEHLEGECERVGANAIIGLRLEVMSDAWSETRRPSHVWEIEDVTSQHARYAVSAYGTACVVQKINDGK